jgi:hypothetical protein
MVFPPFLSAAVFGLSDLHRPNGQPTFLVMLGSANSHALI